MSNPQPAIFDSPAWHAFCHGVATLAPSALRCAAGARNAMVRALPAALPQHCALCAAACGATLLCVECDAALPRLGHTCRRCALPVARGAAVCAHCCARPPPWTLAIAPYAYAYPVDRLLHALKYRGVVAYAPLFARALVGRVEALPDAIVALPLSRGRQRDRGYNQAAEIARPVARRLGVPLLDGLRRTRDTPALAGLPWRERHRSMRHAFAATAGVRGLHVALIDDVFTTGATLRAATHALQAGGAVRVDAWVVARTLPPSL